MEEKFKEEKTKFLGITMDKELYFDKQRKDVKEQMIKANNLLKYINNIGKV